MYKINPIDEAILRVDYSEQLTDLTAEKIKIFHNTLGIDNSELKEKVIKNIELDFSTEQPFKNINIFGNSGNILINGGINRMIIDPTHLALTTKEYTIFKEFSELFIKGLDAINKIETSIKFKRIGLRYINNINKTKFNLEDELKEYINEALFIDHTKIMPVEHKDTDLRRNMNYFIFKNEEYFIRINSGIWNNNYPGKIIEKGFIIDIDCYIDNIILDLCETKERLQNMNDISYNFFKNLIEDKFEKILING